MLTGRFADKPSSLTTRRVNALVDAIAILPSCQRNVLSANWFVNETSMKLIKVRSAEF